MAPRGARPCSSPTRAKAARSGELLLVARPGVSGAPMANPRQRRKVKAPLSKVSRRSKVTKKAIVLDKTLSKHWNPDDTLEENYARIGLANHLNNDICKRAVQQRLEDWNRRRRERNVNGGGSVEFDSEDEMFRELEGIFERPEAPRSPRSPTAAIRDLEAVSELQQKKQAKAVPKLSEHQRQYIGRLIEIYRDDYKSMAMDIKLNVRQLTPHQLERLALQLV